MRTLAVGPPSIELIRAVVLRCYQLEQRLSSGQNIAQTLL